MNTNELKTLIKANAIGKIKLVGSFENEYSEKMQWSVCIYSREEVETKIGPVARYCEYWNNSSRSMEQKSFTSLDRAYAAIRKIGYEDEITISE